LSVLIKDVVLKGRKTHIYIEGNRIAGIGKKQRADRVIDGRGLAACPGLINTHTHLAMTLLRGYADDMELEPWLNTKIWPAEANLSDEFVQWGSRLGILEMIKSGTTCFVDMYFYTPATGKVVKKMGIRGLLAEGFFDFFDEGMRERIIKTIEGNRKEMKKLRCPRIIPGIGPHTIYTASPEGFKWCADYARENDYVMHYHLSETEKEVKDCVKDHGVRPAKHLQKIGVLGPKAIAAHGVWLNASELKLLAKNNVSISNNPVSNQKMGVGKIFPYKQCLDQGLNLTLGTDGAASNNTLDMFESMKFASLQAKLMGNPTLMDAHTTLQCATLNGAKAVGIDAGEIKKGKLADIILVDLKAVNMVPNHDLTSNLVYSANGSNVHTTICDGKVLMENRKVRGEKQIIEGFDKVAKRFVRG
jgi:5-methylthioadenosine/S-adenosylhomocysteine deaminase